jgi:hypothetical protein
MVEVDPLTDAVTWSYQPPLHYASSWGGSVQRPPDGNTLITATERGRVLEVTPNGEVVWEYANPERRDDEYRANIWRMVRFDAANLTFLSESG